MALVPDNPELLRTRPRRERRTAGGIPRLPWRRIVNPFAPVEILSADHVEAIHEAGLRILRDVGVEVLGSRALDAFERAGAGVRRERDDDARRGVAGRVRLEPAQVEALVAEAPPRFELHARNPERNLVFGDRHLVIGAVGGPAFVTDIERGRRPGTFADFQAFVRVIGALDIIQQEGGGVMQQAARDGQLLPHPS